MAKDPAPRSSEELIARAYDALEEDDLEQAIDLAREAISQDPDDVEGYYIAGLSLFEIGEYGTGARLPAGSRTPADPDDPLIATYYGAARFVMGEEREAEALPGSRPVRADPS